MNAKRWQTAVSIALGCAAAVLIVLVIRMYAAAGRAADVTLAPAALTAAQTYALVDLNEADEAELQLLPGIGEVMAARIVEYREEHGPFRSDEDILAVAGVGEATLDGIAPYITY